MFKNTITKVNNYNYLFAMTPLFFNLSLIVLGFKSGVLSLIYLNGV